MDKEDKEEKQCWEALLCSQMKLYFMCYILAHPSYPSVKLFYKTTLQFLICRNWMDIGYWEFCKLEHCFQFNHVSRSSNAQEHVAWVNAGSIQGQYTGSPGGGVLQCLWGATVTQGALKRTQGGKKQWLQEAKHEETHWRKTLQMDWASSFLFPCAFMIVFWMQMDRVSPFPLWSLGGCRDVKECFDMDLQWWSCYVFCICLLSYQKYKSVELGDQLFWHRHVMITSRRETQIIASVWTPPDGHSFLSRSSVEHF